MGVMSKTKKDNILKPHCISGPGPFRIQFHFFLEYNFIIIF